MSRLIPASTKALQEVQERCLKCASDMQKLKAELVQMQKHLSANEKKYAGINKSAWQRAKAGTRL